MFSAHKRQVAFQDIECLVFGMVDMPWRREARWQRLFEEAECLPIICASGLELHECAKKPHCLSLLVCQHIGIIGIMR